MKKLLIILSILLSFLIIATSNVLAYNNIINENVDIENSVIAGNFYQVCNSNGWGHANGAYTNSHNTITVRFYASEARTNTELTFYGSFDADQNHEDMTAILNGHSGTFYESNFGGWNLFTISGFNINQGYNDIVLRGAYWKDWQQCPSPSASGSIHFANHGYIAISNDAPSAANLGLGGKEDRSITFDLQCADPNGDVLTYIDVSSPTNGILTSNGGKSRTYTPNQDYSGGDSFNYKCNDGNLDSNTATVTISINEINDGPTAYDVTYTTPENQGVLVDIVCDDPEGDSLTYMKLNDVSHGSLTHIVGTTYYYVPNTNYAGLDSFDYICYDYEFASNQGSVTINVQEITCYNNNDCGIATINNSCNGLTYNSLNITPTCFADGTTSSYCSDIIVSGSENCNYICGDIEGCDYTECSDSVDNDIDGFIDFNYNVVLKDPGCDNYTDNNETDCVVDLTNTSWSEWVNESCLPWNVMNQTRYNIEYDSHFCGVVGNSTVHDSREYGYCDYCTPDLVNSTGSWYDISLCRADDTILQERIITQYDANSCNEGGDANYSEYQTRPCDYCTPNLVNTTGSWYNITQCLANDTIMQARATVQYDDNFCGEIGNSTTYEYQSSPCDYCTPNLVNATSSWDNTTECMLNDTQEWERYIVQYDDNFCGEVGNSSYYEYDVRPCDYCTPNLVNETDGWYNATSCMLNDTQEWMKEINQYDDNFCGEVGNSSYYEYDVRPCDYCTPNLVNSTGSWYDVSLCRADDTILQERLITQYDDNFCGEVGNSTTYDYQTRPCDYCTPNLVNSTGSWYNITQCLANDTIMMERIITQSDSNSCGEGGDATYSQRGHTYCDYEWPPYFVSVPITEAYPDIEYKYDSDAEDPDKDVLTYSLLYGPNGITINSATGMITWDPTFAHLGNCYPVSVQATDGMFNVTQDYSICVDKPSVEKYPRRKLYIDTVRMNNMVYDEVTPCDSLDIDVSYENWGVYDVKRSTIRVTVYELGISRKIGPFNGPYLDRDYLKTVPMVIPEDAEPGVYTLRMALTTNDQVKRVKHRDFRVI
jgi:hypothetical protein